MFTPKLKVYHSDRFDLPLPQGHRFPMEKYSLLRKELVGQNILSKEHLHEAPLASKEQICRAHNPHYFENIQNGTLDKDQIRKIGFPWSEVMIKRSCASVGGFITACKSALENGVSANLSGGTHHSFESHGEGFCVFNDFAVAAHELILKEDLHDILILDLDVHHGNGNASLLSSMPEVFVTSFHSKNNFPYQRPACDLDLEFDDHTVYDIYLEKVLKKLTLRPWDIIFYQAGVDALKEDSLGKLDLSHQGLIQRDKMVFQFAKKRGIPLAMGLGGGYSKPIAHTLKAHLNTYKVLLDTFWP